MHSSPPRMTCIKHWYAYILAYGKELQPSIAALVGVPSIRHIMMHCSSHPPVHSKATKSLVLLEKHVYVMFVAFIPHHKELHMKALFWKGC